MGETGVTALVQGNRLLIGGALEGSTIADAGLSSTPDGTGPATAQVPGLPLLPLFLGAALLLHSGLRMRRPVPATA